MLSKSRLRKVANRSLVTTMVLCVAVIQPTYLAAGPCEDAAIAAYDEAIAVCTAALNDAQIAHEAALAAGYQALADIDAAYAQAVRDCNAAYDAAIAPYQAALDYALGIAEAAYWAGMVACNSPPDPLCVLALWLAYELAVGDANWIYQEAIAPYAEDLTYCLNPAYAQMIDESQAVDESIFQPANAAWEAALEVNMDCSAAAGVELSNALLLCEE